MKVTIDYDKMLGFLEKVSDEDKPDCLKECFEINEENILLVHEYASQEVIKQAREHNAGLDEAREAA